MALQASGTISISDIATEFGGTAPHSLSEYYRGGGLVPDTGTNSGVPTSGAISLSDFYGAEASADVTPNTLSWTGGIGLGPADEVSTASISGITASITLSITDNMSGGAGTLTWRKNAESYTAITNTLTVSDGDTVTLNWNGPDIGSTAFNGSINVVNNTDSSAVLSTITVSTYE